MIRVPLTDKDLAFISRLARDKEQYNRNAGIADRRFKPKNSATSPDLIGLAGEFAFEKVYGLRFNREINKVIKHDFVLPDGATTVDVKCSGPTAKFLIVPHWQVKEGLCDLYVMGTFHDVYVELLGYINKERFTKLMKEFRGGPNLCVETTYLTPMEDFERMMLCPRLDTKN